MAQTNSRIKVVTHERKRGTGYAVRSAREHVTKDYVFWNDIDGHFNLDDLSVVIPLLADYDMVVAFKHNVLSTKLTSIHFLKSRVNYYLIKLLFNSKIKDFQFVQFIPREFFCRGMILESYSSFVPPECIIKAQALGLSIAQIKLVYQYRFRDRKTKSNTFKTIIMSITNILTFWFRWYFLNGRRDAINYFNNHLSGKHTWRAY